MQEDDNNDLIGRIYETALSPGDWVGLLDTITGWTAESAESAAGTVEVDQLVAHLERAVRSSAYMHALEDRTQVLHTMYSQMPWPMLMLDERLHCLECNPAARRGPPGGSCPRRSRNPRKPARRSRNHETACSIGPARHCVTQP